MTIGTDKWLESRRLTVGVLLASAIISQAAAQATIVRPLPGEAPLDNPLKGWCPYTDAGEIHQPYSMVFLYVPWNELEPASGEYRFEQWEKKWDVRTARDKHIVFRVFVDYPGLPSGLPAWLRKAGVHETRYQDHGGGMSPDYNHPEMVAAMERLIAALGRRYNDHPRVAFIQLGLLGFWGEWHTWPRDQMYASEETERRVIDAYRNAFPDKSLMVRYARDHAGKQPWIGFHDDMFPEDTDNGQDWSFLAGIRDAGRTANWKRAVVGGEMVPHQAEKWVVSDFGTTTEMIKRSHFTWVGPYCPALKKPTSAEYQRRSREIVQMLGYQYRIVRVTYPDSVSSGQAVAINLAGENTGVAPFYYPWRVDWALLDRSGKVADRQSVDWDIRKWLPGSFDEDCEVTFNVPEGTYRLALGIRDPWQDRPAIGFANRLDTADGWTIISDLRVSP